MKYLVILVVLVILVRIDMFLHLFDLASAKIKNYNSPDAQSVEIAKKDDIVSMSNDMSLNPSQKTKFLSVLEDFHSSPTKEVRERAMEIIKANPAMFGTKLDLKLQAAIFSWRDLVSQGNTELPLFLIELIKALPGENQEMIKTFFTLIMDNDIAKFLSAYSKVQDAGCSIATQFADPLSDLERFHEYQERKAALDGFLNNENAEQSLKGLAFNCQVLLKAEIDKLAVQFPPDLPDEDEE